MHAPTPLDTLRLWEQAHALRPPERSLALVAAAYPEADDTQLRAMPLGACHAGILHLRLLLLGASMACEARCPACNEKLEFDLSVRDLLNSTPDPPAAVEVQRDGTAFVFRPPTLGDVIDAQHQADPEAFLSARCLAASHSAGLPGDVVAEAERKLAEADPLAIVVLSLACPACEAEWQETFDVAGYVLREIGHHVHALLHDVHRLASRYGWTEADVLALSPWRRQQYLAWAEA